MQSPQLNAEKITHPFQLMAAWFVMLILLVGLLLTGAAEITSPSWIPGFLTISAVGLSLVVMAAVFAMLTLFRPHLQGPKEYAGWLKDQRRFSNQSVQDLEIREVVHQKREVSIQMRELSDQSSGTLTTASITTIDEDFASTPTSLIEVSRLRRADKVVVTLRQLGFRAQIYEPEMEEGRGTFRFVDSEAIWIGSEISPSEAILAIKNVFRIWPHLCYLHLSSDGGGPDYIHQQMFFGGATTTAQEYGLAPWTSEEILAIPDKLSPLDWHDLVRAKYGISDLRRG